MKKQEYIHQGKRDNQEDSLGSTSNIYIVCDGIGGHQAGEIASNFVVDSLLAYFKEHKNVTKESFETLLKRIQEQLNAQLEEYPERSKMGTTLVALVKLDNQWMSAHLGDSRLYHIRPSKNKIWHTWDHSLVGHLVKKGHITREEGRKHPRNNEIGKAILANSEGKLVEAEIHSLNRFKTGDLLFICSDGVNESWGDEELLALLCENEISTEEKLEEIQSRCAVESRDNNTAFLLEVGGQDILKKNLKKGMPWFCLKENKDFSKEIVLAKDKQVEIKLPENDGVSLEEEEIKSPRKDKIEDLNDENTSEIESEEVLSNEITEGERTSNLDEDSKRKKNKFWLLVLFISLITFVSSIFKKNQVSKKEENRIEKEDRAKYNNTTPK